MRKPRYKFIKWKDLQVNDVIILWGFGIPSHYVVLGNPRPHAYVCNFIVYDVLSDEDASIEQEAGAFPDDVVSVLNNRTLNNTERGK